ncbi:MAG: FkbM family methyltransferase [Steroidobacteraceae bacterium]
MTILNTLNFVVSHPLNCNQKFAALQRFAKWQIGSRLISGAVLYEWINGARFLVRSGDTGLTGNIYAGLHEFPDMAFVLHMLRPTDLFIDAGANVGSYTILACAAAGARGIAFEPVPKTYARLLENVRLNNLEARTSIHNAGLGKSRGKLAFTASLDTMNHALAEGEYADEKIEVELITLDETVVINAPTMIKIDVEGYEIPVIEGAQRTLGNPFLKSVIMELNGSGSRYGYDEEDILRTMLRYGFEPYSYEPFSRKLIYLNGKNQASGNTIFVRDTALVNERVRSAQRIKINGMEI